MKQLAGFESLMRKCHTKEDIPLLFETNRGVDNVRASSLAWRCSKLESSDLELFELLLKGYD